MSSSVLRARWHVACVLFIPPAVYFVFTSFCVSSTAAPNASRYFFPPFLVPITAVGMYRGNTLGKQEAFVAAETAFHRVERECTYPVRFDPSALTPEFLTLRRSRVSVSNVQRLLLGSPCYHSISCVERLRAFRWTESRGSSRPRRSRSSFTTRHARLVCGDCNLPPTTPST